MTLLALTAALTACGGKPSSDLVAYSRSLKKQFPHVQTLTTAELAAKKPPPVLLDVRTPREFAVSHLPGAIRAGKNLPAELEQRGLSKETRIVVYCSVGYRSALAAQKLAAAGFSNVRNLEGSLFAWSNEGRPLVNAHGPTIGTHPYNRNWGRYLNKNLWRWNPSPETSGGEGG